jgi:NodT family efflux transporter outer membrane factor (OMF) lipoprotein
VTSALYWLRGSVVCGCLAACAVGPNYVRPKPPAGAEAPLVSFSPSAESRAPPPDAWWQLYRDPVLDALLREAFAANYDLKAAEANLSGARAILEGVRSARLPATQVSAGGTYGRDADVDLILELTGRKPVTDWVFDDLLDMSYEVDLFGRVRRSIEAARANAGAVAAARDALKVTVAAETARAYAEVCTLGEEIAVAEHSLEVVSREEEITAARHDAGANSDFDVVRAQALVAEVRATLPLLRGQRRAALFQLAALIGHTPSTAPDNVLSCETAPRLASLVPIGDGALLLRRRPDVREAERQLAAATAEIGVATADLYPRVSLTGLFGGISSKIDQLGTNNAMAWGVGPAVSWQFPNIAGTLAAIHRTKSNAAAALAHFDSVVLQALKETEQALSAYTAELDHHQELLGLQVKSQRAFDLARTQFAAGSVSNLDLLSAEQSLVTADALVVASDAAVAQDEVSVFKALGGGWSGNGR